MICIEKNLKPIFSNLQIANGQRTKIILKTHIFPLIILSVHMMINHMMTTIRSMIDGCCDKIKLKKIETHTCFSPLKIVRILFVGVHVYNPNPIMYGRERSLMDIQQQLVHNIICHGTKQPITYYHALGICSLPCVHAYKCRPQYILPGINFVSNIYRKMMCPYIYVCMYVNLLYYCSFNTSLIHIYILLK